MVRILAVLALLAATAVSAGEMGQPQQMPQHLHPQTSGQNAPGPQMPRHMPQNSSPTFPNAEDGTDGFLLYCRTNRSEIVFFMKPDIGLVQNVSSFPKMTGALFVSDVEYILVFAGAEMAVPVEFVVSRYTGRLTAVADGTTVVFTGLCRKGRAKALF